MNRRDFFRRLGGTIAGGFLARLFPSWLRPKPDTIFVSPEMHAALMKSSAALFNPPQAVVDAFFARRFEPHTEWFVDPDN
jgi:hypothetical protein